MPAMVMARFFFGGLDPIGRRYGGANGTGYPTEVIDDDRRSAQRRARAGSADDDDGRTIRRGRGSPRLPGLYGLMAYTTASRTNEIGVRLALGATPGRVLRLILRDSVRLVAIGVAIGLPAAIGTGHLLSARLFGVGAADLVTITGATSALALVATIAGLVPARRAARLDPVVALRCD